ncbi:MAG: bifunctional RNase H/acid phosphatase [Actinomycetota bacterium]|nr:bifunctional RNase H/acid phosphatase [Actinomycetota bacterium]
MLIEADGGARGNPGPAGYGAVVRDAVTGEVLAERSAGLGTATNNVAEYSGLIGGLQAAIELGATAAEVRMDSKLVVEQMSGRWRVRNPQLQPLASQAATLARRLGTVRYEWVPRARNAHADRLANQAMDTQAGTDLRAGTDSRVETGGRLGRSTDRAAVPVTWTGATGHPTRLLLLRHGQTELSAQRRYSGRGSDPELTVLGEQQARAAAARLGAMDDVRAVVCSPLRRARHTAEVVAAALGAELAVHDGLIETDFGAWEGLTFAQARERDPDLHARWLVDTAVAPPGGESMDAVHHRVHRVRDELLTAYSGATLVLVSHVTPIKSLLRMALDVGPSLLHRLHLDIASLSIAEFYPDGPASVRLVNDTSYLQPRAPQHRR